MSPRRGFALQSFEQGDWKMKIKPVSGAVEKPPLVSWGLISWRYFRGVFSVVLDLLLFSAVWLPDNSIR